MAELLERGAEHFAHHRDALGCVGQRLGVGVALRHALTKFGHRERAAPGGAIDAAKASDRALRKFERAARVESARIELATTVEACVGARGGSKGEQAFVGKFGQLRGAREGTQFRKTGRRAGKYGTRRIYEPIGSLSQVTRVWRGALDAARGHEEFLACALKSEARVLLGAFFGFGNRERDGEACCEPLFPRIRSVVRKSCRDPCRKLGERGDASTRSEEFVHNIRGMAEGCVLAPALGGIVEREVDRGAGQAVGVRRCLHQPGLRSRRPIGGTDPEVVGHRLTGTGLLIAVAHEQTLRKRLERCIS